MKKVKADISKTTDSIADEPMASFSHLVACFAEVETGDDNQSLDQGFPYPREDQLYKTGYLLTEFLKC